MKSRTLAQALIETGHVRIDGKRVEKPSEEVRVGSVIALPLRGAGARPARRSRCPTRRGPPAEARCCYEELGDTAIDERSRRWPSECSEEGADQP